MTHKQKVQFSAAVVALIIWIVIGTASYRYLEDWNWVQSFYFSIITLTTVGYGDLHPTNDVSRIFTSFYVLSGVTVGVAALGIIGSYQLEKRINKRARKKEARINKE